MSLPAWAMAPDSGARKPILIGAWAAAWWNRPSDARRASDTDAMGSRMRISSVGEKTRSRQPRRHGAIERVLEGAGLPANDPEGAVGEEARQMAKAPWRYTGEPAAQGRIDG